jgi:uncharacterized protein (DUF1800 family)
MSTSTINKKTHRPRVVAGLTPYTGVFEKEQITHLLKRTMFGAKKTDIDFFMGKTLVETINTLLTEPPPLTDAQLPLRNYAEGTLPMGATWAYAQHNADFDGQRRNSLKIWWIGNMTNQPRSIFEKMVLFWHNHFATGMLDSFSSMSFEHVLLLRKYALGNFKKLTRDVTLDPNMLLYLNGNLNKKSAPDENYGRELQELFTLGKGPNVQYTEADVKAAARVLTGWTFSRAQVENPIGSGKYYWNVTLALREHDTDPKQFSAFYDNKVITNTTLTEAGALKELDEMLDMIFAKEEVALYLCRRIYRFFVYYEIDETIETEVIKPLATIFRQANYAIKPVLEALFSSAHFFETGLKACLIKSPLENVVGLAREFDVTIPKITTAPETEVRAMYNALNNLVSNASSQSQYIGDPPDVSGWPAYYQEPGFHENWINTDTFAKRLVFSDTALLTGRSGLVVDVLKFTDQFGRDAEDPNTLITRVLEIMYRVPPTEAMLTYLKTTILLDGQASDYYWTEAWLAYKTSPTTANTATVKTRLQQFYLFITRNPEYQLI